MAGKGASKVKKAAKGGTGSRSTKQGKGGCA